MGDPARVVMVATDDEFLKLKAVTFFLKLVPMRWSKMLWIVALGVVFGKALFDVLANLWGGAGWDSLIFAALGGMAAAWYTAGLMYRAVDYWKPLRWHIWSFRKGLTSRRPVTTSKPAEHAHIDPARSVRWTLAA